MIAQAPVQHDDIPRFLQRARLARKRADVGKAVGFYRRVIDLDPLNTAALCELSDILLDQDMLDDAAFMLSMAVKAAPADPEPVTRLAEVFSRRNDYANVVECRIAAARLDRRRLGDLLALSRDLSKPKSKPEHVKLAARCVEEASKIAPGDAGVYIALGDLYKSYKSVPDALSQYAKAVELGPSSPEPYKALFGITEELYERLGIKVGWSLLDPVIAQGLQNDIFRGNLLYRAVAVCHSARQIDRAVEICKQALKRSPNASEIQASMGRLLLDSQRPDEARPILEKALRKFPKNNQLLEMLGKLEFETNNPDKAIPYYERAKFGPNNPLMDFNIALCQLDMGDIEAGWRNYERGLASGQRQKKSFEATRWHGEDLTGKTVLATREQGVGDELLFASCLPELIRDAGHVYISCEPRLEPLYRRSFPDATVVPHPMPSFSPWVNRPGEAPKLDYEVFVGSLPRYYRKSVDAFPDDATILVPDADRVAHWRDRLAEQGGTLRVGLSWRSLLNINSRTLHYAMMDELRPLFDVDGVVFVNLQPGWGEEELAEARDSLGADLVGFEDLDLKDDFDGVVALIKNLDVVIAPIGALKQTAVGAGAEVWMFEAFGNIMALGHPTRDPWNPKGRRYKKQGDPDWLPTFGRMADELSRRVAARS